MDYPAVLKTMFMTTLTLGVVEFPFTLLELLLELFLPMFLVFIAYRLFNMVIKNYPDQSAMIRNSEISIAKCYYEIGQIKTGLKRFALTTEISYQCNFSIPDWISVNITRH